jgi:hypothetical protein
MTVRNSPLRVRRLAALSLSADLAGLLPDEVGAMVTDTLTSI